MDQQRKVAVSQEVYRPVIRLVVALLILAIINWILTSLPMVRDLKIAWLPVSPGAIVSLIIGIIMISAFITFGRDFSPRLQAAMPSLPESGTIVASAVILGVVTIADTMVDEAVLPFMKQFAWVYPLVFLLIAIWPLYTLIATLYRSSDRLADLATVKIAEASGEVVRCGKCGGFSPRMAAYCTRCGAQLALLLPQVVTVKCSKCGAENKPDNKFCLACGESLVSLNQG